MSVDTHDRLRAADAAARTRALDPRESWLVQAPAGSGKTELLVQRMLALLATVDEPERVVAVTFTKKAAAEMRARIVAALADAHDGVTGATPHRAQTLALAAAVLARDAARGWRLRDFPGRLAIGTLDALSARIAAQLPVATALGGAPRPDEDAARLYRRAASRAVAAAPAGDAAWGVLAAHFDNDVNALVDLLTTMLGTRDQWMPPVASLRDADARAALERVLAEEVEAELVEAAQALSRHDPGELVAIVAAVHPHLGDSDAHASLRALAELVIARRDLPPPRHVHLAHWRTLAHWLMTKDVKDPLLRKKAPKEIPPIGTGKGAEARRAQRARVEAWLESARAAGVALARVRRLPDPAYSVRASAFIDALVHVLPKVAAELVLVFAEEGRCDFAEVTLRACEALGGDDPSAVLMAQDLAIDHLLVDEFQDTSKRQLELLARLTAGWVPGDGRTLFVVGDPMQSIYAFREADVGHYLEAARQGRIGEVRVSPLALCANFRSEPGLVDCVNALFPRVLEGVATRTATAVAFGAAVAARERLDAPHGDAVTFEWAEDAAGEAARVVARVAAALAEGHASIGVLLRRRKDAEPILASLAHAGIACEAIRLDALVERPISRDLLWLARALTQPADRLAWLTLLRAPFCGIALGDLFTIATAGAAPGIVVRDDAVARALSREGVARLRRLRDALMAQDAARDAPLARRVRALWMALGGPAAYGVDAANLVAAEAMLALVAAHDRGGDIDDFDALCDEAEALQVDAPPRAGARVHLLTVHGAKGLEFDVVVLPGLARAMPKAAAKLLRWRMRTHDRALLIGTPRAREDADPDPIDAWLAALDADDARAEAARLLYVGFTRAKARLHLTAVGRIDDDPRTHARTWRAPSGGSPLAMLWPLPVVVAPPPPADEEGGTNHGAAPTISPPPLLRLPGDHAPPPMPADLDAASPPARDEDAVPYDWAGADAAAIGTVVHRALAALASADRLDDEGVAPIAMRARFEAELAALGVGGDALDEAARRVEDAIAGTLRDTRGRWLFDPTHGEAASELALTTRVDGDVRRIAIDRTFVADGVRWIVDFKTSRHEGSDTEAFLASERLRHAPQLERYARALAAIDARPIRLALYYPLLARLVDWAFAR